MSRNLLRGLAVRIGALAASGLVAGLLLEGLVLLVLGEQPKFPRHVVGADFGVRINQPNAVYRHKSADMTTWFRINSAGMRADRDYPLAKPAGVQRIVSLGDSFTIGYEVDVEQCFSSVLERELRKRGRAVEVLNAGVSGYSNAEAYLYFERRLVDYQPDVVMVSFYPNDFVDNVRTNLFKLEDGKLVSLADHYLPGGRFADFLNTNAPLNLLSGYSNAFAALKEAATTLAKAGIVTRNIENLAAATTKGNPGDVDYDRRLAAAIFEALYADAQRRGVALVIHSLPGNAPEPPWELIETFPLEHFDVARPGILFVSAREALLPHFGKELLFYERSHGHWTPFAHRVAGEFVAQRIAESGLLERDSLPQETAQRGD